LPGCAFSSAWSRFSQPFNPSLQLTQARALIEEPLEFLGQPADFGEFGQRRNHLRFNQTDSDAKNQTNRDGSMSPHGATLHSQVFQATRQATKRCNCNADYAKSHAKAPRRKGTSELCALAPLRETPAFQFPP
jgi:hypothetical protein